jgi:hypothetical protein
MSNDREEPEIVVIASKEVVIRTNDKQNNNKIKKESSTSHQKITNESTDVFKMILTTNGVVDLGD